MTVFPSLRQSSSISCLSHGFDKMPDKSNFRKKGSFSLAHSLSMRFAMTRRFWCHINPYLLWQPPGCQPFLCLNIPEHIMHSLGNFGKGDTKQNTCALLGCLPQLCCAKIMTRYWCGQAALCALISGIYFYWEWAIYLQCDKLWLVLIPQTFCGFISDYSQKSCVENKSSKKLRLN